MFYTIYMFYMAKRNILQLAHRCLKIFNDVVGAGGVAL